MQGSDLNPSNIGENEIFVRIRGYDVGRQTAKKKLFLNDLKSKGNYVCTGSISDSLHVSPFSKWELLLRKIICSQSSSLRKPQI